MLREQRHRIQVCPLWSGGQGWHSPSSRLVLATCWLLDPGQVDVASQDLLSLLLPLCRRHSCGFSWTRRHFSIAGVQIARGLSELESQALNFSECPFRVIAWFHVILTNIYCLRRLSEFPQGRAIHPHGFPPTLVYQDT